MADLRSRIIEAALGVIAKYEGITVESAAAIWQDKAGAVADAVLAVLAPELAVVEAAQGVEATTRTGHIAGGVFEWMRLMDALSRLGSVPEREEA